MPDSLRVSARFPVPPSRVYADWLDPAGHAALTGGNPASCDPRPGGAFTAWEGYISGTTLELVPGRRIVQAWRTSDFPAEAPDSRLVVELSADGDGCRVDIVHDEIPAGQGPAYEQGWADYYFSPMHALYG